MKSKLLLTILVFLFVVVNINAQDSTFNFTGEQVKKIRLIIEDNKFLKIENDSLYSRVNLYKKLVFNLNEVSSMQDTIILYKEKQIKELEAIPKTVVNVNYTKWYVFGGIIVSSIAAGLITGFFIK